MRMQRCAAAGSDGSSARRRRRGPHLHRGRHLAPQVLLHRQVPQQRTARRQPRLERVVLKPQRHVGGGQVDLHGEELQRGLARRRRRLGQLWVRLCSRCWIGGARAAGRAAPLLELAQALQVLLQGLRGTRGRGAHRMINYLQQWVQSGTPRATPAASPQTPSASQPPTVSSAFAYSSQ